VLAGARRFDGGVERQQVGLERDDEIMPVTCAIWAPASTSAWMSAWLDCTTSASAWKRCMVVRQHGAALLGVVVVLFADGSRELLRAFGVLLDAAADRLEALDDRRARWRICLGAGSPSTRLVEFLLVRLPRPVARLCASLHLLSNGVHFLHHQAADEDQHGHFEHYIRGVLENARQVDRVGAEHRVRQQEAAPDVVDGDGHHGRHHDAPIAVGGQEPERYEHAEVHFDAAAGYDE
jgi:hypothetical protein